MSPETFADRRLLKATALSAIAIVFGTELGILQRILHTVSLTGREWVDLHPRRADGRRRDGAAEAVPQVARVATSSALIVCIRFSASSQTSDAADSKTSSVTSIASRPNFS